MKAAHHGSPPLARPNRHRSNSSYDRMKTYPRSDSHNPKMPPFLRLDSAGEVTSLDGPHKSVPGHQRTNSCRRQGPETSAGVSPGKNGLFGKLMSHFDSQPTSSALLESSRAQDSISLDDLLNSKQAFSSVSMPVNPSHVKMAQINFPVPHVPNRYGQWRSMSHCPTYPLLGLPKGVFPCHVIQELHTQKMRRYEWPTSGQFVQNRMASLACSYLDAWTFSPGSSNSSQKTESDSESSTSTENSARCSDKVSAAQSESLTTACDSSQSQRSVNMDPGVGTVTLTVQTSAQKKYSVPSDSRDNSSKYCETLFSAKSRPTTSNCLNIKHKSQTSSPDSDSGRDMCQPRRPSDLQASTTNHRKKQEDQVQAISGKADVQPSPVLEEEWEEIEDPGNGTLDAEGEAESEKEWACFMDCQFSLSNLLSTLAKKGPACEKGKAGECEEGKRRAPKPCPAVTARWRQVYCADLPPERSCKVRFECGKDKDTVFEFVKGEDEFLTVMEMQKACDRMKKHEKNNGKLLRQGSVNDDDAEGDGSDLGAFGGIEQHKQNLAGLPQRESADNEDDNDDIDIIDGDGIELGAVGGSEATPKKQADNAHRLVVGGSRLLYWGDSSSEEEEEPQNGNKAESDSDDDDDDDDDILFEDDDSEQNGIIVEENGIEQDDNESDSEDEVGEQNHYFIAVVLSDSDEDSDSDEESDSDEDSDDDIVFEHEDNSQKS